MFVLISEFQMTINVKQNMKNKCCQQLNSIENVRMHQFFPQKNVKNRFKKKKNFIQKPTSIFFENIFFSIQKLASILEWKLVFIIFFSSAKNVLVSTRKYLAFNKGKQRSQVFQITFSTIFFPFTSVRSIFLSI